MPLIFILAIIFSICAYTILFLFVMFWFHLFHQVTAVVIYNCPTTKSLGLSLSKFHQKATFDPEDDLIGDLSQGDIIDEAVVVRVQKKTSVIVQLNQKTKGIIYVSIYGSLFVIYIKLSTCIPTSFLL